MGRLPSIEIQDVNRIEPLQLLTADEYLESEELSPVKREFVDGRVYIRPDDTNLHNQVAGAFLTQVYVQLRGKGCQVLNSATKIRIRTVTAIRFYYPDGLIVCDTNSPDDTYQDRPVLLAEVLSPFTRRVDEIEKQDAYLGIPSLNAYCLIEAAMPRVVVYERTDGGFGSRQYDGLDAVIEFQEPRLSIPLAELYERVDFGRAAQEAEDEVAEIGRNS